MEHFAVAAIMSVRRDSDLLEATWFDGASVAVSRGPTDTGSVETVVVESAP